MKADLSLLIMGSFDDPGAIEHRYLRGLRKCGWNVLTYEISSMVANKVQQSILNKGINRLLPDFFLKELNRKVVEDMEKTRPDVILIFKGMTLFPKTIAVLKTFTRIICNYNPDHPLEIYSRGGTNLNVINSIPYYDLFITYSSNIAAKLKEKYTLHVSTIPFGYDPALVENYANIDAAQYNEFFLFIGAWDKQRAHFLDTLGREDLEIYGDAEWKTRTQRHQLVHQKFKNQKLYGKGFYNAIKNAQGVINILREQNIAEASHNMRTFEVPGCNGLLLSQYTEEQATFFEPDKEAVYFTSIEELSDKMNFLQNNPATVARIKSNAWNRCESSGYSYDQRAAALSDNIKAHLN